DWGLPAGEVPVGIFLARPAGGSAGALGPLRGAGHSWTFLPGRYGGGGPPLQLPPRDPPSAGTARALYARFQSTPVSQWNDIRLSDEEIVALVNVRVLSSVTRATPDEILRRTGPTTTFVDLYAQLLR